MPIITAADLTPFATINPAKADAMIADALALAQHIAPCITEDGFQHNDAVKAILRGAILRWHTAGTGALAHTQHTAGPFSTTTSIDTTTPRRHLFWPSEINALKNLCRNNTPTAYSVDTAHTA